MNLVLPRIEHVDFQVGRQKRNRNTKICPMPGPDPIGNRSALNISVRGAAEMDMVLSTKDAPAYAPASGQSGADPRFKRPADSLKQRIGPEVWIQHAVSRTSGAIGDLVRRP